MGKKNRITPSEVAAAINSKGGTLLSEYQNSKSYLRVKCARNHEWDVKWETLSQNHWCPYCTKFNSREEQCRHVFQSLTGEEFFKDNRTLGRGLQLDGYSARLGIAFEYDGKQHFEANRYWDDDIDFQARQKRDALKTLMCNELEIRLIRIPYTVSDLENYIRMELEGLGLTVVNKAVDWSLFWAKNDSKLEEYGKIIKDKGGKLLSIVFEKKIRWQCSEGHIVTTLARNLRLDIGCAECSGKKQGLVNCYQKSTEI